MLFIGAGLKERECQHLPVMIKLFNAPLAFIAVSASDRLLRQLTTS